ncbi:DNA-binding domain-containing protein, AraC-type [Polaromonas sp. CF318]|uniref:helix-turn-helix domain-containing protein n=1 Tax=Polaromonas sp. CF318 TaxID=1144318 RepID=UPI0002713591|nr:helix-turn-helix domain-containing protein [Polaromonas sp. CF318]EJL82917.1 DNA-binding domain-containing protein, AraC-type [Polaromonas sp. CF318]
MAINHLEVDDGAIHPGTRTSLFLPSPLLADCVCAYVVRDTLDTQLTPQQSFSHLPVSPLVSIVWLIQGGRSSVPVGNGEWPPSSRRVVLRGPRTQPTVWQSHGPALGFSLTIFPDAFHALTHLNVTSLLDQARNLQTVLGKDWQQMAIAVLRAGDDLERIQIIEAFLTPRWTPVRAPRPVTTPPDGLSLFNDWVDAVALRASASTLGQSTRQRERLIKGQLGLPMRAIRGLVRMESTLTRGHDSNAFGGPSLVDVAHAMGFSDQAHLCREVKRYSGLNPTDLQRAIETQESYWPYRLRQALKVR